jgi:regulator of replication initiation timing
MYNSLMGQMNEMRAGFDKVIENKDTIINALMKKLKELKEENEALKINNTNIEIGPA